VRLEYRFNWIQDSWKWLGLCPNVLESIGNHHISSPQFSWMKKLEGVPRRFWRPKPYQEVDILGTMYTLDTQDGLRMKICTAAFLKTLFQSSGGSREGKK